MKVTKFQFPNLAFTVVHLVSRGAVVEWLEWLNYGTESRCKVKSSRNGLPCDNWKILSVNPAVNGYLFRIREG